MQKNQRSVEIEKNDDHVEGAYCQSHKSKVQQINILSKLSYFECT